MYHFAKLSENLVALGLAVLYIVVSEIAYITVSYRILRMERLTLCFPEEFVCTDVELLLIEHTRNVVRICRNKEVLLIYRSKQIDIYNPADIELYKSALILNLNKSAAFGAYTETQRVLP